LSREEGGQKFSKRITWRHKRQIEKKIDKAGGHAKSN